MRLQHVTRSQFSLVPPAYYDLMTLDVYPGATTSTDHGIWVPRSSSILALQPEARAARNAG